MKGTKQVIDIRRKAPELKSKILVDTNVLYFLYYEKFDKLEILGERPPKYQIKEYPEFMYFILRKSVDLFVHEMNLYEFVNILERAELKILYNKKYGKSSIEDDYYRKKSKLRYKYKDEWRKIQKNIKTLYQTIRKVFNVIKKDMLDIEDVLSSNFSEWQKGISNVYDAIIVSEAKAAGVNAFISDDSDFYNFNNITLYTANKNILKTYYKSV